MTELNLVGTTLGRFEVISELGRGGMAVVYKARQSDLDRIVALKILPPSLTHDASYVARFRQEARSAARLEHPHIMPIYEVGEANGLHYIAMKFIQGRTLKDLVEAEGALSVPRAAQILAQVGESLDYAHRQGVIHRDIKPSNIMITDEGWVYLTDFGLARGTGGATSGLTMAGTVMGTPEYMSPEQAQGLPNVGPPTDIYALGVVLYELITGTFPFQADTPMGMLAARLLQAPTPPRDVRGDLPAPVEDVVMRALARKPEARFPSAAAMVSALRQAAGLSEAQAQRPLTPLSGTPAVGATIVAGSPPASPPAGTPYPAGPAQATPLPPLPPLPGPPQPATPPYVQAPPTAPAYAARPAAAAPQATWQPTQAAAVPPAGFPTAPVAPPAEAPRRTGLFIGIGAVVLVVLLGIVGGLVLFNRGGDDDPVAPAGSAVASLIRDGSPQLAASARLDSAIAEAQAALSTDSDDLAALSTIALAHYLRSDWQATEEYANRLIDAASADDTAAALGYSLLADAMLSQGDVAGGFREAEQAVSIDPQLSLGQAVRSNAIAAEALAAENIARMDEALAVLDQAVDVMADESPLFQALTYNALAYTFSQEYFLSGNKDYLEQSEDAYEQAIDLQPDLALFRANCGFLLSANGDYSEARDAFEEALELDPNYAAAQAGIGWSYFFEDDYARAEEAFEAAIDLNDADYYAHYGLGRLRFNSAEDADGYALAAEAFQAASERNPRSPDVYGWLGEALLFQGFNSEDQADKDKIYAQSEQAYRAALAIDERHVFALSGLGWILQYQEKYPASVETFERVIALDKDNDENFSGMGWSLLYQDMFPEAEAAFRQAVALDPDNIDARDGLGDSLARQGRTDEARAEYEEALRRSPGNARIQESLDALDG